MSSSMEVIRILMGCGGGREKEEGEEEEEEAFLDFQLSS